MQKGNYKISIKSALVVICLVIHFSAMLLFASNAQESTVSKIFGQVVDDANQPIADVLVQLNSLSNYPIRNALGSEAFTDKDGLYSFNQTILEETYELRFYAAGFASKTITVLSGERKEIETVLNPERRYKLTGKVLNESGRQGIRGARVFLIGQRVYKKTTMTEADGTFSFDDVPRNIEQGLIYAVNDNYCTEYKFVQANTKEIELILKSPSRIEGIVTSQNGEPLADCMVEIRPAAVSGFYLTQKTNATGRYQFDNLPGGEYQIYITHPQRFQTQNSLAKRIVQAQSGQTTSFQTTMIEKIPITGQVIGPDDKPVANAFVSVPSYPALTSGNSYDVTRTDAAGNFRLYCGTLNPASSNSQYVFATVSAIADGLGTGSISIRKNKENQEQDNLEEKVVIKLNGAMRIFGQVKDSNGNPVTNVFVYLRQTLFPMAYTDASGYYDLRWFALPVDQNKTYKVYFKMPRPDDGGLNIGAVLKDRVAMKIPQTGAQYYLHQEVSVTAKPGENMQLNPTIVPTNLLILSGTITNKDSEIVVQASVMLFAGNASGNDWLGKIDSNRINRGTVAGQGRGEGFGIPGGLTYFPIARTVTDKYGNYTIYVAKETAQSLQIQKGSGALNIEPDLYSLGIISLDNSYGLITDIIPENKQNQIKIDICLTSP